MVQYNARNSNAARIGTLVGTLYDQGQRARSELQKPIGTPVYLEDRINAETAYNNLPNAQKSGISRRVFVYVAGAIGVAAAVGLAACYVKSHLGNQTTTTTTSTLLDTIPPEIKNYKLSPTNVQNGKPYEEQITFDAQDLASALDLSTASLTFEPIYPPEIPKEAFTPEDPSFQTSYSLKPIAVSSDGKSASFSQAISGFKGGTQYKATIKGIKDRAENEAESSVDNPYIREFENNSKTNNLLVGAFYYPWSTSPSIRMPLLGRYNPQDQNVISKHIDWATGYGIKFFLHSWWGPASTENKALRDSFLQNPLSQDIKFCILYESEGRFGKSVNGQINVNENTCVSDFDYLSQYFNDPRYLKIDGKPAIFMYLSRDYVGDIKSTFEIIRKEHNPWIIGDFVYWDIGRGFQEDLVLQFDAITDYTMAFGNPTVMSKKGFVNRVIGRYNLWKSFADQHKIVFIPNVMPGFNDDAKGGTYPNLNRDPDFFREFCQKSHKHIDSKEKMVTITSFREWPEDTQVEPATDYKFDYLSIIKDELVE
jgi:hypothetical protein